MSLQTSSRSRIVGLAGQPSLEHPGSRLAGIPGPHGRIGCTQGDELRQLPDAHLSGQQRHAALRGLDEQHQAGIGRQRQPRREFDPHLQQRLHGELALFGRRQRLAGLNGQRRIGRQQRQYPLPVGHGLFGLPLLQGTPGQQVPAKGRVGLVRQPGLDRITSYNVCYTKLLRAPGAPVFGTNRSLFTRNTPLNVHLADFSRIPISP